MRPNPVRQKLLRGEPAFGTMAFEFFTPGLASILANAGAEFVILDTEHSGVGIETIKAQTVFARAGGLPAFVRVPALRSHLIAPILDAGAMGIMVPMLETADQARELAAWCRYRPDGTRGLGFGLAHDDWRGADILDAIAEANARTLTIALIETPDGIRNADAIAAVPGIDVLWLGHFDLTNALGITGQFEHPNFLAAVGTLAAAGRRHGKACGIVVPDASAAPVWLGRGYRALCLGTDVSMFAAAMRSGFGAMRAAFEAGSGRGEEGR